VFEVPLFVNYIQRYKYLKSTGLYKTPSTVLTSVLKLSRHLSLGLPSDFFLSFFVYGLKLYMHYLSPCILTERHGRVVDNPALYSESPGLNLILDIGYSD
jgi:hypothetical protein